MIQEHGDPELIKLLPSIPLRDPGLDGYDWLARVDDDPRWRSISGWGRDGWDMGDWPYVIVATCQVLGPKIEGEQRKRTYGVATYVEGDITVYAFATHDERMHQLDSIFHFYADLTHGISGVAAVGPNERCFYGPFSWERVETEKCTCSRSHGKG